jgi:hypothetical protein
VSPKSNTFDTTARNKGEIFINAIEGKGAPPFPDIPSESDMDNSFFIGAAMGYPMITYLHEQRTHIFIFERQVQTQDVRPLDDTFC